MNNSPSTFLVLGATGRTGQHFVRIALEQGHQVNVLVRHPAKMEQQHERLLVMQGSITEDNNLDELLLNVDCVICMLGDARRQQHELMNTSFVKRLIPAMRRQGVSKFLYQAGGFTRPYKDKLPLMTWILKHTMVRFSGLLGQHRDNESVIKYLVEEAQDIDWIVHRTCIIAEGETKGDLKRSRTKFSLATFGDCAAYNVHLLNDASAIHTYDLSYYS